MGSISIREHIRWGSDDPSEPTSTLVLTSPGRRFVDIRVLNTALSRLDGSSSDTLSRDSLDWAFGGTSVSSQVSRQDGSTISHSVFRHWVDSRTKEPEKIADEGDMFPQPGGLTLETGRMVNPANGIETDYEELWREEEPQPAAAGQPAKCVVFQLHDDPSEKRGLFIRLGKYAQGVLRIGGSFTAERWQWSDSEAKWGRLFKIGDEDIPTLETLSDNMEKEHLEGDLIDGPGGNWVVMGANS